MVTITKLDKDALKRAMQVAGAEPDRAEQLAGKLTSGESWTEVAEFAAYCAQGRALRLRPGDSAPCAMAEAGDDPRDAAGRALLRRMLLAGVSRFEPDPLAALAEAGA